MDKTINIQDIQTAQEQWFIGSTSEVELLEEKDWYIPQGVLKEILTIDETIEQRKAVDHFESRMLARILYFGDDSLISVGFSDIDKKTGMTYDDPKILGLWDKEKGEIVEIKNRDLTQEVYDLFKKSGEDLHLRETRTIKEKEDNSKEQKG